MGAGAGTGELCPDDPELEFDEDEELEPLVVEPPVNPVFVVPMPPLPVDPVFDEPPPLPVDPVFDEPPEPPVLGSPLLGSPLLGKR